MFETPPKLEFIAEGNLLLSLPRCDFNTEPCIYMPPVSFKKPNLFVWFIEGLIRA
jgi:hypothetical protein